MKTIFVGLQTTEHKNMVSQTEKNGTILNTVFRSKECAFRTAILTGCHNVEIV
jgi:hypothetical protein